MISYTPGQISPRTVLDHPQVCTLIAISEVLPSQLNCSSANQLSRARFLGLLTLAEDQPSTIKRLRRQGRLSIIRLKPSKSGRGVRPVASVSFHAMFQTRLKRLIGNNIRNRLRGVSIGRTHASLRPMRKSMDSTRMDFSNMCWFPFVCAFATQIGAKFSR